MTAVLPGRAVAAPTVVAAAAVATTGAGLLLALSRPSAVVLVQGHLLGDAATAFVASVIGAAILTRIPRQAVGLLFAGVGAADALALLASGAQAARIGGSASAWAAEATWRPGLVLLLLLPVVVPDGPGRPADRLLLRAGLVAGGVWTVAGATTSRLATGPSTSVANPLAVPGADLVALVALVACGAVVAGGLASLAERIVRGGPAVRRRLLPVAAALLLAAAAVAVAGPLGTAGTVLQDVGVLLVPVACLISVLRLHLVGIEVGIGRSVVWIALTGALVAAYVLVVQVCGALLRLHGIPASVIATAVVAVAFAPVRTLLQRAVDRSLYGDRGDPAAAVAATTRALGATVDPATALRLAADRLAAALRCPAVAVLRDGRAVAGVIPSGSTSGLVVALRLGGASVGELAVQARGPGERFTGGDERLLAAVAPAFATALAALGAAEDAAAARARLALAREDERRAVHARLHDDVGPSLAAVGLQAATAGKRLERGDAAGAAAAIDALRSVALRASADLRAAVDTLAPSAVDELGLPAAVEGLAAALSDDRLSIRTNLDVPTELPAAIEQTAYRIVAECLTNVRRHSGAASASVRIAVEGGEAVVEVRDDGDAATLHRSGGVGLPSMRARAEELGGSLTIRTGAGTLVRAVLPLP